MNRNSIRDKIKEGYRGMRSSHCRLSKSLPSISVWFGELCWCYGPLTNSFSGSQFRCPIQTGGAGYWDGSFKNPIPPVWMMVTFLTNSQHSLYHLTVSFLITSFVSCIYYLLLYNKNRTSVSCENLSLMLTCLESSGNGWVALLNCAGLSCLGLPGCQLIQTALAGVTVATWLCFKCFHPPSYLKAFSHGNGKGIIKEAWWVSYLKFLLIPLLIHLLISHWPKQVTWLSQSQRTEKVTPSPDGGLKKVTSQRLWIQTGWKIAIIFAIPNIPLFHTFCFNLCGSVWHGHNFFLFFLFLLFLQLTLYSSVLEIWIISYSCTHTMIVHDFLSRCFFPLPQLIL